ncbi:MAG: hypothetical protein KAR20_06155, partial [Candidatus Heimdallarchaeota archaeon]|nr:hypothetical protein [Candidatus Heimdallarchaeota archaeon]
NKQTLIIDVDRVIASYNKKNPEKLPMTRKRLAEILDVNPQLFSDWKRGKTPKWTYHLMKMIEIGDFNIDDFIVMAV